MKNNIRKICGNWDLGYALDKHTIRSIPIGYNEFGHMQFDTTRTEVGEALYQLKYQNDWSQVEPLAHELASYIYPLIGDIDLVVPMPATQARKRQPVVEIADALGAIIDAPVNNNILCKSAGGAQLKDITDKEEKLDALKGQITVKDRIESEGINDILLIDDVFDTGATVEVACEALRGYKKIGRIYLAALTWK